MAGGGDGVMGGGAGGWLVEVAKSGNERSFGGLGEGKLGNGRGSLGGCAPSASLASLARNQH